MWEASSENGVEEMKNSNKRMEGSLSYSETENANAESPITVSAPRSTPQNQPLKSITFGFYETSYKGYGRIITKKPKSQKLVLTVLSTTTLRDLAELLFKHYLEEILGEALYEHLWRFSPVDDTDLSYSTNVPILSNQMNLQDPFHFEISGGGNDGLIEYTNLHEGNDMVFRYDEGTPTEMYVSIERVKVLDDTSPQVLDTYPMYDNDCVEISEAEKKRRRIASEMSDIEGNVSAAEKGKLRKIISEMPIECNKRMDEALPFLSRRLCKENGVKMVLGRGHDPFLVDQFCRIWGGASDELAPCAYISSLISEKEFTDMDECVYAFDRGIEKQMSPGFPIDTTLETYREADGSTIVEERFKNRSDMQFRVHVRPYPLAVPRSAYKEEMIDGLIHCDIGIPSRPGDRKLIQRRSRWAFNYSLADADSFSLEEATKDFSFSKQFPKCAKWISYPYTSSKNTYAWFEIECGKLNAYKGKAKRDNSHSHSYSTMKHDNLHDMFIDMEKQLVMPKSW